ncbi:rhodanese-like domain-containing protein [Actinobacillus suis]|uniref:Periplasmic protein n=2 Tax=Actinobacillus suis TaxID=716 RepID=K0G1V0_ACTSU|nr:rhodanese-like domain-containing protein [Actinobacillus suis]AFU18211.1 periplasmic protein [Actinobacillus suis H91-0380]AIJ30344.1 periplasmic protein [Actinobacillus suis ATCC 33415]MCO4167491.1 rhodanese-like domain-containing protein [Actinobacillus suis]MCO4169981.1 rhodanese-like domain-containing protein [Actinobacillus suis]MCQ9630701.1 rhodanese-like domain-containing protein [Actinobacillus suis]
MLKKTFPLITALLLSFPMTTSANESNQQVVNQSVTVEKAQGVWIDVRTAEEFAAGHIEGAINIPVEQIGAKIHQLTEDKDAPIHLYCRSGRRADIALTELQKLGYRQVTNHGGYQDLLHKGIK